MSSVEHPPVGPEQLYSPFDRVIESIRRRLFGRWRALTVAATVAIYAGAMLALGPWLGVSANFIVIIPIISASIGFGLKAGLVAGIIALPANLLCFALLGRPEYAPASKAMAELAGIVTGTTLGYLADYRAKLETEREIRKRREDELRNALRDRETLFREVHHRVKNNLNLVKSIIGLQARRSRDPAFRDAAASLTGRIMSISFVHERLYRTAELSSVAIDAYLGDLVGAITMSVGQRNAAPTTRLDLVRRAVSIDTAIPLGLIVNELATNALRHGKPDGTSVRLEVSLAVEDDRLVLTARDDGVGIPGMSNDRPLRIEDAAIANPAHLGFILLDLMSAQLGGDGEFIRREGWTEFRLSFPAGDSP